MITSRLRKQAKTEDLLVQFPQGNLCKSFQTFLHTLHQQRINTKRSPLPSNTINFYTCQQQKTLQYNNTTINLPKLNFQLTLIYFNQQSQQIPKEAPTQRTLIIRQGLQLQFSLDYQIEETISEQQTVIYLCHLSASLINNIYDQQVQFYDQKTDQMTNSSSSSVLTSIWTNILYQIPGIGKQKCLQIVKQFPTYQSILKDSEGLNKLAKIQVARASKTSKLGPVLAQRIYKVMTSIKGYQQLI